MRKWPHTVAQVLMFENKKKKKWRRPMEKKKGNMQGTHQGFKNDMETTTDSVPDKRQTRTRIGTHVRKN